MKKVVNVLGWYIRNIRRTIRRNWFAAKYIAVILTRPVNTEFTLCGKRVSRLAFAVGGAKFLRKR